MSEFIELVRDQITRDSTDRLSLIGWINLLSGSLFVLCSKLKLIYQNEECVDLKQTSLEYGILLLIMSLFCSITISIALKKPPAHYRTIVEFFQIFYIIIEVLYFILLLISFNKEENCGTLHTIVLIYFIVFIVRSIIFCGFLGLSLFAACLSIGEG